MKLNFKSKKRNSREGSNPGRHSSTSKANRNGAQDAPSSPREQSKGILSKLVKRNKKYQKSGSDDSIEYNSDAIRGPALPVTYKTSSPAPDSSHVAFSNEVKESFATETTASTNTSITPSFSHDKQSQQPVRVTSNGALEEVSKKGAIFDDPDVVKAYDSVPLLEITSLPRGGVSMDTQAVGRVQFGIPPETIKDSMKLGLEVPSVYIVPVERFCREMGPALGVNLAEFEFPAYFNFFVQRKQCTLVVDSLDAERNIRRVFSETLLGPAQFRREDDPIAFEEEDFSRDFPREAIPNFQKELKHFRMMPDGKELVLETLLKFCHFSMPGENGFHENLGVPPPLESSDDEPSVASENEVLHHHEEEPKPMSRMPKSVSAPDFAALLLKRSNSAPNFQTLHEGEEDEEEAQGSKPPKPQTMCKRRLSFHVSDEGEGVSDLEAAAGTLQRQLNRNGNSLNSISSSSDDSAGTPSITNVRGKREKKPRVPKEVPDENEPSNKKTWTYSQAKWIGDVSTVYPKGATPDDIAQRKTKRVEIFKMPGGTEYILHDIDEDNIIVGKARFTGHVRVSESMSVHGFKTQSLSIEKNHPKDETNEADLGIPPSLSHSSLPTFHPPSFGVTVLGNSHGFDKSGSTSGYVLWINGRGVMIDPPPYSSATLEREGIRPRTIVGIILTHCHADHDAGAFQKVLTGSPVVVITTPTIYKSFIRKYAALSALSPALLRHSHRHKPAYIGVPLRFQGATFYFTYTLHSIPCVGFRVEWRGRSMVFTGDHFNSPDAIDKLQEQGVLSNDRADDLRNLPLQETDLLLHEAGAPPIHTPLDVLLKLPKRVKQRLYVVHTSALPEGCELRVAPTGTAGTIRLDRIEKPVAGQSTRVMRSSLSENTPFAFESEDTFGARWSATNEYDSSPYMEELGSSFAHLSSDSHDVHRKHAMDSISPSSGMNMKRPPNLRSGSIRSSFHSGDRAQPLVSLRPNSSTDAWFTLNLLSAVPFLSSLSYSSTMEVLETARVDGFCTNSVVVAASRRRDVLVVVWEGTCVERRRIDYKMADRTLSRHQKHSDRTPLDPVGEETVAPKKRPLAVWYAGDWTGPRSLQPDKHLSGESATSEDHDIVAVSSEGVKAITIEFSNLHAILKSGSDLYRKYLKRSSNRSVIVESLPSKTESPMLTSLLSSLKRFSVIELLDWNSALRKLSAVQKRHLESLAEGPVYYGPGQRLWRAGQTVDKAFIIVAGTVSFVPRRRNAGSVGLQSHIASRGQYFNAHEDGKSSQAAEKSKNLSIGEAMRLDAQKAIQELKGSTMQEDDSGSITSRESDVHESVDITRDVHFQDQYVRPTGGLPIALTDTHDFALLSRAFQKRADFEQKRVRRGSDASTDLLDSHSTLDHLEMESLGSTPPVDHVNTLNVGSTASEEDRQNKIRNVKRRSSSRDRFANKVLGRLYNRRAFTAGLVFSRGHFLGDVSKMVAGLLSSEYDTPPDDDISGEYGFGEEKDSRKNGAFTVAESVIHEQEGDERVMHSSTLSAGKEGCVVLYFPKSSLIPFLDEYPGLLLSLLGTQVVV